MTVPSEIEVKLELPPTSVSRLRKVPLLRELKRPAKTTTEVSVYFDTENRRLRKKGVMLRVRRIGEHYVQTIKATRNSGVFERDEWENEIADGKPDLHVAKGTALAPLLKKASRRLQPLFETRVRRTIYPLANGKHEIALTLDKGQIATARHSKALCEVELELKRGDEAELFKVARELAQALPVQLALKSKAERGYELIDGDGRGVEKAASIELAPGTSTRNAFRVIALACLKQVIGNEPALLAGDAEGVHQMRVGLRRLRAAMSLFKEILQDAQTAALKDELRWLTGELGPARELEVLVARVAEPVRRRHARWHGMASLSRDLSEQREAAVARAQEAVRSERFRLLTIEIAAWIEAGQWTRPQDEIARERGDIPIERFAAEQLTRRFRKIRKKGRKLAQLEPRARHKLRIQAKKVRYASEFFATVFPGKNAAKRRRKFVSALEQAQDCLGDLTDIAVHENRTTAIVADHRRRRPRKGDRGRAFAAGVLTGHEDARLEPVLQRATEALAAMAKAKPFWD